MIDIASCLLVRRINLNLKSLEKIDDAVILSRNNTRQGYVLRNTLKLAGYFFLPLKN
jgi:hypothetical protein